MPRSLDVSAVEALLDVERHFPAAIAHLKTPSSSAYAAEQQTARRWHDVTHTVNVDGIRPAGRDAPEVEAHAERSFFEEGGMDIRGGRRDVGGGDHRPGHPLPPPTRAAAESPDILQLTGGSPALHGLALAETSNAAPADLTLEPPDADRAFGDTPVQLVDMLRERLMELKAEKLRDDRSETFLPRRLPLVTAADRRGGQRRRLPPADVAPPPPAPPAPTTLAEWTADAAGDPGAETAIRADGIEADRVRAAAACLRPGDRYVPGGAAAPPAGRTPPEGPSAAYLHRVLSRAGYCSRREAAALVASGQVRVNNVVARDPFRLVAPEEDVHVAGHAARLRVAPPRLWMYHKPSNVIVSRHDGAGRALITRHARILGMDHLIPVGSLPMRAHGVLLLTNDGELSRFLENPRSMIQQTYLLRVRPAVDPVLAHTLNTRGIHINGQRYDGAEFFVNPAMKSKYSLQVKVRGACMPIAHLLQHLGRVVERGGRVSFGPFALGSLALGSLREVTVPPHYVQHLGAVWKPFVERDWPYFRRQRVARLRRLGRYRELTPKELEELEACTGEELREALSFDAAELSAAASERAASLRERPKLQEPPIAQEMVFGRAGGSDIAADGWKYDDLILEDITAAV